MRGIRVDEVAAGRGGRGWRAGRPGPSSAGVRGASRCRRRGASTTACRSTSRDVRCPVAVPGHTTGHTAWHLPGAGAVISGDALVTGHPTTGRRGPQLLDPMFHHDPARARASFPVLAGLGAEVVVPGHGPVHHGPVR